MRKLTIALASLFVLGTSACASIRPAPGPGARTAERERVDQQQRAAASEVAAIKADVER